MSKNDNELKRMRLKVDERGLGRVLATLNVGKILIPALAELFRNMDMPTYLKKGDYSTSSSRWARRYSGNLLFNVNADLIAIPVRSASHYIDVLSAVLQGKPFAEGDLDEISLLFLNKGVNIMIYDGGQQLQKGDMSVPMAVVQGHGSWVCLTFQDDAFTKMAGRFFTNQRRMDGDVVLPENLLLDNFMAEVAPEDFQPVIEGIDQVMGHPSEVISFYRSDYRSAVDSEEESNDDDEQEKHQFYFYPRQQGVGDGGEDDVNTSSELDEDDMQESPDDVTWKPCDDLQGLGNQNGVALSKSSEDSFTATFSFEGNPKTVQLWQHYKSSGISMVPVYEGVAYSASGGNMFFYQTKSIERELGMVSFNTQEGKKVYDAFLRSVADEVSSIERVVDGRLAADDLREVVDYCRNRLEGLVGNYITNFYVFILELKKVPNFRIPNMMACLRLLDLDGTDKSSSGLVLKGLKEDKTILIDRRYFEISAVKNQTDVNAMVKGIHSAICVKKSKPYPPHVPEMEFNTGDEKNYKGRAYIVRLNKRLFEIFSRNPSTDIYTVVSDDGNMLTSDDEVPDDADLGILVPDDMIVRGEGKSLVISPDGNLSDRILAKKLVDPVYVSRKIRFAKSEEGYAAVVKLDEIAKTDVIVFRNGKPYKIPYNRMQEYGVRRTTDRLDVAFMYEDRALVDPLYSIRKKGLKFPKGDKSVLISEVEAYDGVFLSEGDE